ncbi:MAG TPA: choice-of-anchor Q domain-containing protein [Chitinivibrionales bacterium]|nr:choice-of-anchor Q domain-containing protein [Chitinivibrionales bacterium]
MIQSINKYLSCLYLLSTSAFCLTYHVSPSGSDAAGDGSSAKPWATISGAAGKSMVQGGDTILVADGTYNGSKYIGRSFSDWLTVRAEYQYKAKLTNIQNNLGGEALSIYTQGSAKIRIEGFVFSNVYPGYTCPDGREANYLVHFQDACDIVFQNNILFGNNAPGACNELLKINRGDTLYYPRDIQIRGNVFYDRPSAGGTDLIDATRPGELDIYENIFFERSAPLAQSFMTIKREVQEDSMPAAYKPARNPRIHVYKNVFLNWDGAADQAFVQFGEDDLPEYMITNSLIENNLMIGNSANPLAAPIQLKGCKNITVRANTIVGDLPGGSFGFRIGTEGTNPRASGFYIYNNIWCDPTGTMTNRFVNTYGDVDTSSITLSNNLFWNKGDPLPSTGSPLPAADARIIVADPLLDTNQSGIVLPVWDETNGMFTSGSTTIRQEFERLVNTYGSIPSGSPAIGAADAANMPVDDILGNPRDTKPDIGAFEFSSAGAKGKEIGTGEGFDHNFNLKIIQNISGKRILIVDANKSSSLDLYFYDLSGRQLLALKNIGITAGRNVISHEISLSGIFLMKAAYNGGQVFQKIFFLK